MLLSRLASGTPEIFASIQGEGVSTGVPSVFVRLAECNLKCTYCDTKYTWDWEHHDRDEQTVSLSTPEALDAVTSAAGDHTRNVVLTGGEPLLQQTHLVELAGELKQREFRIEVETSGTIEPSNELAPLVDQWNVSPKLSNSGNRTSARLRTGPLTWFAASPRAQFKFVVTGPEDLDEVLELAKRFDIPRARIMIMPEGTDAETLTSRARALVGAVASHGFRLGTRMHVLLWGSERGR